MTDGERMSGSHECGDAAAYVLGALEPQELEAFRAHLRRLAADGTLPPDIVRIGPFWSEHPPVEIDAVPLPTANTSPS